MDPRPDLSARLTARSLARLAAAHCPDCSAQGLVITSKLQAKPIGTYSLAGATPKVAAQEVPVLSCQRCGWSKDGVMVGQ